MTIATIFKFQLGQREAIDAVARSRSAFLIGACLVLITSIPRNYDQLAISEHTLRWIFGPLVFSMLSGSLVFLLVYWLRTAVKIRRGEVQRTQGFISSWVGFMGLFWMTAPIAWLYAIPMERLIGDAVAHTQANLVLLAVVALWRVVLLARVLEVVCDWAFGRALGWVLAVAAAEVLALVFFSPFLAQNMLAGMGGMRNSPAEELLVSALIFSGMGAVCIFPIAVILAIFGPWGKSGVALPLRVKDRVPMVWLAGLALLWIGIAVYPQKELGRSVRLERLVEEGSYREAIEMMNGLERDDFSPSRELPPKEFEWEIFEQGGGMIGAMQDGDAEWVQRHALARLERILKHLTGTDDSAELDTQIAEGEVGRRHHGPGWMDVEWDQVFAGLERTKLGREWLSHHTSLQPRIEAEEEARAKQEKEKLEGN